MDREVNSRKQGEPFFTDPKNLQLLFCRKIPEPGVLKKNRDPK